MKPILEIQSISKKFRIHHQHQPYLSIRDNISSFFLNKSKKSVEDFWALKDVSFTVEQGESIGIIGKNGAGKSTLLKILSKITPPTSGKIVSRGRIASLLEVGTGFHAELSGKENIFLNGSILGMKRREIETKFDEIVDFSGVEKFLDTPLKHYSSGMQLRLAFAVAAFLDPEILIIDEVLAVGDAEFQKKCLSKMDEVSKSGRTILFVSHNLGMVKSLCQKAILLHDGKIEKSGNVKTVSDEYLGYLGVNSGEIKFPLPKDKNQYAYAEGIHISDDQNQITGVLPLAKPYTLAVDIEVLKPLKHFIVGIGFTNIEDTPVRTVWSKPSDVETGRYEYRFTEDSVFFTSGKYKLIIGLSSREHAIQSIRDHVLIEFEEFSDKEIALHTNSGVVLNQMKCIISKTR